MIFTNRSSHADFVVNAIKSLGQQDSSVNIAVPFFTDYDTIDWLTSNGCQVRLIVRLGYPTNPSALTKVLLNDKVQVRFFTDSTFHSKLFLFGDRCALIGSANLTGSALTVNQEIMITVPAEDERFEELAVLFGEYWADAQVLSAKELKIYENLCKKYDEASNGMYRFQDDIIAGLGKVVSQNITRSARRKSSEALFLENYRKTYQETVSAFKEVKNVYESVGSRKVEESVIPLRLEIDSFLSYVRKDHAQGDSWLEASLLQPDERRERIKSFIEKWHKAEYKWFESHIVAKSYPVFSNVFDSAETMQAATDDELFDALCVEHSFLDRRRFYSGGLQGLKKAFFSQNDRDSINESLTFLVFGSEEIVMRMYRLIFDSGFKLKGFGKSNVQELIGWKNKEELPVVNGRTTKVLRYFGFDVRQCQ